MTFLLCLLNECELVVKESQKVWQQRSAIAAQEPCRYSEDTHGPRPTTNLGDEGWRDENLSEERTDIRAAFQGFQKQAASGPRRLFLFFRMMFVLENLLLVRAEPFSPNA